MKNKTLIILLIVPFIIGLLSFVSIIVMENITPADIVDIIWNYGENYGYQIRDEGYLLEAEAVVNEDLVNAEDSAKLVWKTRKINESDEEYAVIKEVDDKYYLHALKEGVVQVVCSNKRGSVSKYFTAHIFKDGQIIINPEISSGSNVDKTRYFGQYDLSYNSLKMDTFEKKNPTFKLIPELYSDSNEEIFAEAMTTNVSIDSDYNVTILGSGEASVRFFAGKYQNVYSFKVIEEGYNVYSYNDLMMCTNFSSEGLKVVLQTSLQSLSQTYVYDAVTEKYKNEKLPNAKNVQLFGNYNFSTQRFSFEKELYETPSTYNTKYIDQYNEFNSYNYKKNIRVGIRLQQDLYGNGFTINAHGLAYPNHGKYAQNGVFTPSKELDYFYGPLPFMTIGHISELPIVKAYGQDNVGLYVDNDNIIINDLKMRNTDEISNMYNLLFTGSVIDVHGSNVTIKNSIISNGRTVVRAFDSDNLLIENSILKNANEFLLYLGSDEYNLYDENKSIEVTDGNNYQNVNFNDYFNNVDEDKVNANNILNEFVAIDKTLSEQEIKIYKHNLTNLQAGLDNTSGMIDSDGNTIYKQEVTVKNTYFNNSGIFSIAFDTAFNGAYLYSGLPSAINSMLSLFSATIPNGIGGTSFPVKLNLDDSNHFYDWKDISKIDSTALIEENISYTAQTILGKDVNVSIDDFFPMKPILVDLCRKNNYIYKENGVEYINSKIAWYGGGNNLSDIAISDEHKQNLDLSDVIDVDILDYILRGQAVDLTATVLSLLAKAVTLASGFHSFKFITNGVMDGTIPNDFGKVPQVEDLYKNR